MNPDHDWELSSETRCCFHWHRNVQIEAFEFVLCLFELITGWNPQEMANIDRSLRAAWPVRCQPRDPSSKQLMSGISSSDLPVSRTVDSTRQTLVQFGTGEPTLNLAILEPSKLPDVFKPNTLQCRTEHFELNTVFHCTKISRSCEISNSVCPKFLYHMERHY